MIRVPTPQEYEQLPFMQRALMVQRLRELMASWLATEVPPP